jgi:molybdopterin converting factor small subunit
MSIEDIVHALGAESWLENGITVALNGEQCPLDIHPSNGDEVALLPPVSGG